jgi:serine/threonine protein kinase
MFPFSSGQLGAYRLIRRIGGGGMGEVYLAEDTRMGFARQVAIKTIRAEVDPYPDQAATKDAERLFRREMQAITKLDHPYILPLYDFGEERVDDTILTYMVMPFRPEGSLANWLQKQSATRSMSLEEVAHFVGQAAQALHHAHTHELIHQDVKPANFLIRDRPDQALPDILLADFGIVKIATATATASQSIRGTPAYMAPEQWNGQPVPATDQYALAIMAYLLLTRRFPFKGSMEQVMRQHLDAQPQAPGAYNLTIPPDLDTVILHALQKSPVNRFASILAFANAFKQAIGPAARPSAAPVLHPSSDKASAPPISPTVAATPIDLPSVNPAPRLAPAVDPGRAQPVALPLTAPASSAAPYLGGDTPVPVSVEAKPPTDANTVPPTPLTPPAPPSKSGKKRRRLSLAVALPTLGVIVLLIIASVTGVVIHQNQVNADAQATADAEAAATAQVVASNPCPSYIQQCGSFSLALFDTLQGSSSDEDFEATGDTSSGGSCQYASNDFEVSQSQPYQFYFCNAYQSFDNFVFEVQMTSVQGDCGGMVIEYDSSSGHGYLLEICPDTQRYILTRYAGPQATDATFLIGGTSSSISNSATNTLAIVVNNGAITIYVNQQMVDSVNDNTYTSGLIGLVASASSSQTTATYTNARMWT